MLADEFIFDAVRGMKELKERERDILEWLACVGMPKLVALHCMLIREV